MKIILCLIVGYLVGTINPTYFYTHAKGIDMRSQGTGNMGATNALFVLGRKYGIVFFAFDVLKALLLVLAVHIWMPEPVYLQAVIGVACFLGHVFPFYLKFQGGKGSATFVGIILGMTPLWFPLMLLIAVIIGLITDCAFILPVGAILVYPWLVGLLGKAPVAASILAIMGPVSLWKHRKNFRRLRAGEEPSFRQGLAKVFTRKGR